MKPVWIDERALLVSWRAAYALRDAARRLLDEPGVRHSPLGEELAFIAAKGEELERQRRAGSGVSSASLVSPPKPASSSNLMRTHDVAELAGVTPSAVRKAAREGRLVVAGEDDEGRIYQPDDVQAWMASRAA